MTDVKRYRRTGKAIEWYAGKYDNFKLVKTGDYRMQNGSGRSEALALAKDGMLVGTWTKKCAEAGLDPVFCTNSIQKLMTTKAPGWSFSEKNADGITYEDVKGSRKAGKTEEKAAKKNAKNAKADAPKGKGKGKAKEAKPKASKTKAEKADAAAAAE